MNSAATSTQVPVPAAPPARGTKRTRAGELWVAAGSFAAILLLLLIFMLENT